MSSKLVEYELDDGSTIVFETDDDASGAGSTRLSSGGGLPERAEKSLKEVSQRIGPAAQTVLDSLKEINTPKEVQMEFGLKFSLNAGLVVAKADSAVNFKVTVKWVNKDAAR